MEGHACTWRKHACEDNPVGGRRGGDVHVGRGGAAPAGIRRSPPAILSTIVLFHNKRGGRGPGRGGIHGAGGLTLCLNFCPSAHPPPSEGCPAGGAGPFARPSSLSRQSETQVHALGNGSRGGRGWGETLQKGKVLKGRPYRRPFMIRGQPERPEPIASAKP